MRASDVEVHVDGINFRFAVGWRVCKYDDWKFYRGHWIAMRNNIKALDMLAIDPSGTAWMIEVKDYTRMPIGRDDRPDAKDLGQIVSDKVFDTLAAILPASVNAADADEKSFAIAMTSASRLRVVLHLEQPASRSRLWPRPIDPAHIKQSLKQRLKPVDRHPVVASMGQLSSLAWAVDRA